MSEGVSVAKVVVALGLIFLLVGLLYEGQGYDTGWTNFVSVASDFPEWDPFAMQTRSVTLTVAQNGTLPPATSSVTPPGDSPVGECYNTVTPETTQWYECITTQDGNRTYVVLNSGGGSPCYGVPWCSPGYQFMANLTGIPGNINPNYRIMGVRVDFECERTVEAYTGRIAFSFYRSGADISVDPTLPGGAFMADGDGCPYGSGFASKNATSINPDTGLEVSQDRLGNWTAAQMTVYLADVGVVDVSYVTVTISYLEDPTAGVDCGGDFLCQIGVILGAIGQAIIFALNILVFGVEIVLYLFGLAIAFLSMLGFLFALPDTPAIVQGIVTAFVVGCLILVIIVFVGRARGSGMGV